MTNKIRIAIAGLGNCASSLVQGIAYYGAANNADGTISPSIGGYEPGDIEVVAAFDVDERKVGRPVAHAVFAAPNCTMVFCEDVSAACAPEARVHMGPVLDGVAEHMEEYEEGRGFRVAKAEPVDVAAVLKRLRVDVLVCYLPVGSQKAVEHYAGAALLAGCGFVNCVPVFIASNPQWASQFVVAGLPIIGDDIKSQVGATILHRLVARLFRERGYTIDRTYQLNTGGNTDFLNMRELSRLASKKKSKTQSVTSQIEGGIDAGNVHIGPSDYVPFQNDNKVAFIRMEGTGFGGAPIELEMRLSVQDSPNSAGVVMDAVRYCALAMDASIGGPLTGPCAYLMKSPPAQMADSEAGALCRAIAAGEAAP